MMAKTGFKLGVVVYAAWLAVFLTFAGDASATDGTYTNGHGATGAGWFTTGDWINGIVASGVGAVATFSNVNNTADQVAPPAEA